ncbi:S-layer homology domain-containing protein [Faecalitalea cylindroides]|uniref:S-layer homology domain-containing protein n=1 Tax=Faecalitalea cylindroides TaxID=39483 RepID=UPI0039F5AB13
MKKLNKGLLSLLIGFLTFFSGFNCTNIYAQDLLSSNNSIVETEGKITVVFILHESSNTIGDLEGVKYEVSTYDLGTDINTVDLPEGYSAGPEGNQATFPNPLNEQLYIWELAKDSTWDDTDYSNYIDLLVDYVDIETNEVVRTISIGLVDKANTTVDFERLAHAPNGYVVVGDSFPIVYGVNEYGFETAKSVVTVKKDPLRKAGVLTVHFMLAENGLFHELNSTQIDLINFEANLSNNTIPVKLSDVENYIPNGYKAIGFDSESIIFATLNHPFSYQPYNSMNIIINKDNKSTPFNDLRESDWFHDYVKYVYENSLMTGLNETTFGPYENLARAQFAVILHRMNGQPSIEYTNKFPDVAAGQWYTDAILWANDIGVVTGYSNTGLFGTGDQINREQMAVMMYRYAQYKGYDTSASADFSKFNDAVYVNDFAKDAMSWAVGTGIITGKDNETRLDPQGSATRAECATIIMRYMEYYK